MGTKIIGILLLTCTAAFSQIENLPKESKISPAVKSLLLPGWGEKALDNPKRSTFFFLSEVSLWLSVAGTFVASEAEERKYTAYAADHAGVDVNGKSHDFWVDIGNYSDRDTYNEEHLRFRENDDLYSLDAEWDWSWDDAGSRSKFEGMRLRGDRLAKATSFLLGGVVLNHVISAIDAAYLQNLQKEAAVSIIPKIDLHSQTSSLSLSIRF